MSDDDYEDDFAGVDEAGEAAIDDSVEESIAEAPASALSPRYDDDFDVATARSRVEGEHERATASSSADTQPIQSRRVPLAGRRAAVAASSASSGSVPSFASFGEPDSPAATAVAAPAASATVRPSVSVGESEASPRFGEASPLESTSGMRPAGAFMLSPGSAGGIDGTAAAAMAAETPGPGASSVPAPPSRRMDYLRKQRSEADANSPVGGSNNLVLVATSAAAAPDERSPQGEVSPASFFSGNLTPPSSHSGRFFPGAAAADSFARPTTSFGGSNGSGGNGIRGVDRNPWTAADSDDLSPTAASLSRPMTAAVKNPTGGSFARRAGTVDAIDDEFEDWEQEPSRPATTAATAETEPPAVAERTAPSSPPRSILPDALESKYAEPVDEQRLATHAMPSASSHAAGELEVEDWSNTDGPPLTPHASTAARTPAQVASPLSSAAPPANRLSLRAEQSAGMHAAVRAALSPPRSMSTSFASEREQDDDDLEQTQHRPRPLASPSDAVLEMSSSRHSDDHSQQSRSHTHSPAHTVKHQDHASRETAPSAALWGSKTLVSPSTTEALSHASINAKENAENHRSVSPPHQPPASAAKEAVAAESKDAAVARAAEPNSASIRNNASPIPATAASTVAEQPLPPLSAVIDKPASSPSAIDRLLARTSARLQDEAARAAEAESQRVAKVARARDAQAATEAGHAHRRRLAAQLPDSHFDAPPVPTSVAGRPRLLQAASATAAWRSKREPFEASLAVGRTAIDFHRLPGSNEAMLASESYDRAAASFAHFLRRDPSTKPFDPAAAAARARGAPTPFSALDFALRVAHAGTVQEDGRPVPGQELLQHELSARAKGAVKRAADATMGRLEVRQGSLPARRHTGAHEPEPVVPSLHERLSNPATAALLRASASSLRNHRGGGGAIGSLGLSARARALAAGSMAPPGSSVAAALQAPIGSGIARMQDRAAEATQRVLLLRLAWREREAEQAALAAGMAAAAADSLRLERHESEVLAMHDALRRREAAERQRLREGDPLWEAPSTRGEDAGFYSALEREHAARVQLDRLRARGVDLTPRTVQGLLARGADCEADEEEQGLTAGGVPIHGRENDEDAAARLVRAAAEAAARWSYEDEPSLPLDHAGAQKQYDEHGCSLPPTPRPGTVAPHGAPQQLRPDEREEKYPSHAWTSAHAADDGQHSPGRVMPAPHSLTSY